MPSWRSALSFAIASSTFWRRVVSVTSRTTVPGSTPLDRRIAAAWSAKATCSSWRGAGGEGGDLVEEGALLELAGRDVDADLEEPRSGPALVPRRRLAAGPIEDPAADVEDQVRTLGHADEFARPDHPALRVDPADERFDAGHPTARHVDDRLVVEDELVRRDGALEGLGERMPLLDGRRHLGLEEDDPVLAPGLRRVHRDVGVAEELVGGAGARMTAGDADADVRVRRSACHRDLPERVDESVGNPPGQRHLGRVPQEDGKLVAADTGREVARPEHRLDPLP